MAKQQWWIKPGGDKFWLIGHEMYLYFDELENANHCWQIYLKGHRFGTLLQAKHEILNLEDFEGETGFEEARK